jgi:hydroxymethylpyrimidine/phosphomethylpyrimidine kinase
VTKRKRRPIALTIAGSDSGGGAGIQADLRTFAALGVHGTTAITCITAQNPREVAGVQAVRPEMVRRQLEAVFAELRPAAVKTGMLYERSIIRTVAAFCRAAERPPVVVDPVMVATSGARLLRPSAIKALIEELMPLAALATPNLDEAKIILEREITTVEDLRRAARDIHARHRCPALVKGGHLRGLREAVDFYYDGQVELLLSAPRIRGISTHGTGCAYSAAIAGYVALGRKLPHAVQMAKEHVTQAISQSVRTGRHCTLEPFWGWRVLNEVQATRLPG